MGGTDIKRSRVGLIPGGMLLLAGLVAVVWVWIDASQMAVTNSGRADVRWSALLLLVPGVVLLATYWRAGRSHCKLGTWALGILLTVVAAVGSAMWLGLCIFIVNIAPVDTDIRNYPAMRASNAPGEQDLMAHFPKEIPRGARSVRYRAEPGFLQGGSSVLLQFEASDAYIRSETARFERRVRETHHGSIGMENANVPPPQFYGWRDNRLPPDFEVIVIGADPSNHGRSVGVAASIKRHTIIYWAEDW